MARNWMNSWREASFRGASFWVDKDQLETGRRLVTHEFPHRDKPYVEDMGRSANKVQVTAYVASDEADSETQRLYQACGAGGAATLVLPAARMRAHCEKCTRDWTKDRQGFFAFDLSFVVDGAEAAPISTPYLARLTHTAAEGVVSPIEARFIGLVQVAGEAGFVRDAAIGDIQTAAVALDAARASLPMNADKAPGIALAAQQLYDDAVELAAVGETGDSYEDLAFVASGGGVKAAPLVTRITGLIGAMREASTDPALAARELGILASYEAASRPPAATPSARQILANGHAIAEALRIASLAQWVVALTEAEYGDRRAAIQARADVAEAIESEMARLAGSGSYGVFLALSELRGRATQFFTELLTNLAPVIVVEAPASMPSLWWANALYGDALRAGEIAERNRAIHPSFMPTEIEALAR